jgi:peptide/nickel transport system permease protein
MGQYLIRRLLLMALTLIGVSFLAFAILRLVPGGVENAILGEQATPEQFVQLRHSLGLDQPIPVQYVHWLLGGGATKSHGVVRGDLGESLVTHRVIANDIRDRLPVTLELGGMAMIVSILIAVPVGLFAAMRQDTMGDYTARSFAIGFLSIPGFWIGTLVITFGARLFGYAPPLTYVAPWVAPFANLQIMVPPAIILGAGLSGTVMRLTRTQMLDVLRQDYIRTAWAKGLRERTLVWRHALRNAAIPVLTLIGIQVPILFGGTVILEQIFGVPGVGRFLITGVNERDFPAIQAVVLMVAVIVVVSNLCVDVAYSALDPRVKFS